MERREKVLPHYLAGVVEERVLDCYVHKRLNPDNLDAGFEIGLQDGGGLARLLSMQSPELDIAIQGARNYADRNSGKGRNSEILDFSSHNFLYGLFHGLEISTTIVMRRDTEGDVARAFDAVLKKYKDKIIPASNC